MSVVPVSPHRLSVLFCIFCLFLALCSCPCCCSHLSWSTQVCNFWLPPCLSRHLSILPPVSYPSPMYAAWPLVADRRQFDIGLSLLSCSKSSRERERWFASSVVSVLLLFVQRDCCRSPSTMHVSMTWVWIHHYTMTNECAVCF
ncbi:hypothetical protein F4823DRAFT_275424 [Ustulina deusta]|nr:hypothetical protein F4823DRAFT_275424 [Ustulina deusta]